MSEHEKLSDLSDVATLRAAASDIDQCEGTGIAAAVMAHELRRIADHLGSVEAALRKSTELLRQGAYRMVQTAPKEYYRTLDQIDANEAAMGGTK